MKTEFAFLRWFASSATAKLRGNNGGAAELACCARWGEEMKFWAYEQVGQARGSVHVMAGLARVSTARGHAVRRPAMGVTTRRLFFESVNTVDI